MEPHAAEAATNVASTHDEQLLAAAYDGDVTKVRALLTRGSVDVNTRVQEYPPGDPRQNGPTSLHLAARQGYDDVVRELLAHGAAVDVVDNARSTPLALATTSFHADVVQVLIAASASVNTRNKFGSTPLHLAASCGFTEITTMLLQAGADPNAADSYGRTPLHLAITQNLGTIIEVLVAYGADFRADDEGDEPLHTFLRADNATATDESLTTLQTLANCGVAWDAKCEEIICDRVARSEATAFRVCFFTWTQDVRDGRELTKIGLDNEVFDPSNQVVTGLEITRQYEEQLRVAARSGDAALVRYLLDEWLVDVNTHPWNHDANDQSGPTPLHLAALEGHVDVVEVLLAYGADVDVIDSDRDTPLSIATSNCYVDVVRLLIGASASVNIRNKYNTTPLHFAAYNGDVDAALVLLEANADPNATDSYGRTALHHAITQNQSHIVDMLVAFGAEFQADDDGDEPLHTFLRGDNLRATDEVLSTLQALVSAGVRWDATCEEITAGSGAARCDALALRVCFLTWTQDVQLGRRFTTIPVEDVLSDAVKTQARVDGVHGALAVAAPA